MPVLVCSVLGWQRCNSGNGPLKHYGCSNLFFVAFANTVHLISPPPLQFTDKFTRLVFVTGCSAIYKGGPDIQGVRQWLHWSQNRHNTTLLTDSRQGSRSEPRYCLCQRLHCNRCDWNVVSLQLPTVWPDTCCSLHRIPVSLQWTKRI
jgi:hypothetical protein